MGQQWPAAGLGALSIEVSAWDLLKEVTVIFITSTMVWPWVNNREGTQLRPSTETGVSGYYHISLEGMMLKLKLQYFGHLMQRVDSLEKTLMLGGIGGRRRRG